MGSEVRGGEPKNNDFSCSLPDSMRHTSVYSRPWGSPYAAIDPLGHHERAEIHTQVHYQPGVCTAGSIVAARRFLPFYLQARARHKASPTAP